MPSFTNTMGIASIAMEISAKAYCPLGNAGYTNKFDILFKPKDTIPDYVDIDNWVKEHINISKVLTIEECVSMLFCYLMEYEPEYVRITSYVDDAVHFPVKVMKSF